MTADQPIEVIMQAVRESAKYRTVSDDLIRAIGKREWEARRNLKEAIKATKNKLHQVAGAYLETRPRYDEWLRMLEVASGDAAQFQQVCLEIMRVHASTRERIPILPDFYQTVLGSLPPIHSVLDVACGFNPLAVSWMPLAPSATYYACDIYADMMDFLQQFFALAGVGGEAFVCDLVAEPPQHTADLALVLKALPPLEQIDKEAGLRLLQSLKARFLLVSFPAQSLGGRRKGMVENYAAHFRSLIEGESWSVQRWQFASELAFLVEKG